MARLSKKDKRARYVALRDGVLSHLKGHAAIVIAGSHYSAEALAARLQGLVDDIDRSNAAYAAWQSALLAERTRERQSARFLNALSEFIAGTFGDDSPKTKAMGVSRKKSGPKTLASKVEGIEKRRRGR